MKKVYKQFIKFAIVGTSNTLIDFAIYTSLTRLTDFWDSHKISATSVAFMIATINSYTFNKYWTFRNKRADHHIQMTKFIIVGLIGLGINAAMFWVFLPLHVNDLLIKISAITIVLFWNFIANKFWTFAEN